MNCYHYPVMVVNGYENERYLYFNADRSFFYIFVLFTSSDLAKYLNDFFVLKFGVLESRTLQLFFILIRFYRQAFNCEIIIQGLTDFTYLSCSVFRALGKAHLASLFPRSD